MTAGKNFKRIVRQRAQRTGASYAATRQQLLRKPPEEQSMSDELVRVVLDDVKTQSTGEHAGHQIALLNEVGGPRILAIHIGESEGLAIARALRGVDTPRPMTHDAFSQTVDALEGQVERVVITVNEERDVFLADVVLTFPDRPDVHLDCRPSDALALAVRRDPIPEILADSSLLVDYSKLRPA